MLRIQSPKNLTHNNHFPLYKLLVDTQMEPMDDVGIFPKGDALLVNQETD